jgi:hypothetical protein
MTMILTLAVLLAAFSLTSFLKPGSEDIEEQKYRTITRMGELEIRFYPSATLATVRSSARNYREVSYSGFRRIAGYIFGGNEEGRKIAMTSPVHMDITDQGSSMSFVMPSAYTMSDLPRPNDPGVRIEKSSDEYVAAIRFSGFASDDAIRTQTERLANLLREKDIEPVGNFRYLGYDPPYRLIGRRNEIIVKIDWREEGSR